MTARLLHVAAISSTTWVENKPYALSQNPPADSGSAPALRVQARGRLIDNQKFRLAKHCLNEPHSPLHSTGELAHLLFDEAKPRLLR